MQKPTSMLSSFCLSHASYLFTFFWPNKSQNQGQIQGMRDFDFEELQGPLQKHINKGKG
jgi:hypothetical protein